MPSAKLDARKIRIRWSKPPILRGGRCDSLGNRSPPIDADLFCACHLALLQSDGNPAIGSRHNVRFKYSALSNTGLLAAGCGACDREVSRTAQTPANHNFPYLCHTHIESVAIYLAVQWR